MGKLVHRGGGVPVPRSQALDQRLPEQEGAVVVYIRISQVDADRILPRLLLNAGEPGGHLVQRLVPVDGLPAAGGPPKDRKSTRLNSSHVEISYAVFCLKKKKKKTTDNTHKIKKTNTNKT